MADSGFSGSGSTKNLLGPKARGGVREHGGARRYVRSRTWWVVVVHSVFIGAHDDPLDWDLQVV
jgi:hypothetical protein